MSSIIIYGDAHGEWQPLLRACADERPDAVVLLGDLDLLHPLRKQLSEVFEADIQVRWIPGNHDRDSEEWHDRLWLDYPDGNLHAKWAQLGGIIVAGLGGIFHERAWYPRFENATPMHPDRRSFVRSLPKSERWRGGLPLRRRDAIFPEDIAALGRLRADVLVTHEAPSCHKHGFVGIDLAAAACRARLVVHGHHHESIHATLADGTRVRGLAKAEVFRLRRGDLL